MPTAGPLQRVTWRQGSDRSSQGPCARQVPQTAFPALPARPGWARGKSRGNEPGERRTGPLRHSSPRTPSPFATQGSPLTSTRGTWRLGAPERPENRSRSLLLAKPRLLESLSLRKHLERAAASAHKWRRQPSPSAGGAQSCLREAAQNPRGSHTLRAVCHNPGDTGTLH